MTRARVAGLLSLLLVAALGAADARGAEPPRQGAVTVERSRYLMGTLCTIAVVSPDSAAAARSIGLALDDIAGLEEVMSVWRPGSELSRLNASPDSGFTCSPDLYDALAAALEMARQTQGAFDPTIEPLNRLWDLRGEGRKPEPPEIPRALAIVGWRRVALEPETRRARFERPGMGVDLGGIGKGIALDRAAARLRADGFVRGLLNFGGEILVLGKSHPVMIADPAARLRPLVRLSVSNAAVSTSAQSERGVTVDGGLRGHILDPRRGTPVEGQGSVTVVEKSATRADALSTALFVMGREEARAFALARPEVGVLWLETADRTVRAWKWNLDATDPEAASNVEWMD